MTITRRTFLAGTLAAGTAGAGLAVSGRASAAPSRVRTHASDHRVIVVGSGFGGAITALRLTQAGVPVLLLERGREWKTGPNARTFPSPTNPDKRMLWHKSAPQLFGRPFSPEPYAGLVDAVVGDNMTAVTGACLGGGSLLYQGMSLEPAEDVFNEFLPERLDWARMHATYYPRVWKMLRLETAPDSLIRTPEYKAARLFASQARKAGLPVSKIPMPIDWQYALDEIAGKMRPSYTDGSGALGVNNGGKHSVDVTYIKQARATGLLTVATLHEVSDVTRAKDGRWRLQVTQTDDNGDAVAHKTMTTKTLVMSAGSVHTTRLLVRARDAGGVDLPDGVGAGWGTNADRIYVWSNPNLDFGAVQGGPVVYGSLNWDKVDSAHTVIQASIPSFGVDAHSTMMVGYGVSRSRGGLRYDASTGDARLHWPADGDQRIQWGHIHPTALKIAGKGSVLTDSNRMLNTTWHPLGGAAMGAVCDLEGRVHGQKGLYVIDGALIPGTAGACNPSMTIAAVAERALDRIVANDVGSII
ncbi:GMC oxidoreductase [Gordonia liuliyuniae]|uniref:Cholesterol oxidase n=1 Tax=Gordonia liuliyuniae TaxID=2911517 RepID=A0ABS9IPQ1_9ACTN|nr:GMC oxidoreductase [Gordonia liuliyuniae]MCF8587541.1 GMC oxidoreductase [Gordonia liuliyuniae]